MHVQHLMIVGFVSSEIYSPYSRVNSSEKLGSSWSARPCSGLYICNTSHSSRTSPTARPSSKVKTSSMFPSFRQIAFDILFYCRSDSCSIPTSHHISNSTSPKHLPIITTGLFCNRAHSILIIHDSFLYLRIADRRLSVRRREAPTPVPLIIVTVSALTFFNPILGV